MSILVDYKPILINNSKESKLNLEGLLKSLNGNKEESKIEEGDEESPSFDIESGVDYEYDFAAKEKIISMPLSSNYSNNTSSKSSNREFNYYSEKYFASHPEDRKYQQFLTEWAKKETNFRNIQNTAGHPAYGYFQFWHTNLNDTTPENFIKDPMAQFKKAVEYAKKSEQVYNTKYSKQTDWNKAAVMFATILGGHNLDDVIFNGGNRKDAHGTTIKDYLKYGQGLNITI